MNDRRLGLALLAVLVVLDVVLIALALRPAPATSQVAATQPGGGVPSETATAAPSITPVPARLMAFRTGGVAYGATPGTCTGTAAQAVQIPATGPAIPASAPGAVVGRLTTNADGSITAIAGAQDCSGAQQYTQGQDGTWTDSGGPEGQYFVFSGSTDVATPSGPTPAPCSVIAMVSTAERATILCADGQLVENTGGTAWTPAGTAPAGVALAPGAAPALHVLQVAAGCDGLAFATSTDVGRNWTQGGCVQGATATGPVGLSVVFDAVVVMDGQGSIFRSSDSGASFTKGG